MNKRQQTTTYYYNTYSLSSSSHWVGLRAFSLTYPLSDLLVQRSRENVFRPTFRGQLLIIIPFRRGTHTR